MTSDEQDLKAQLDAIPSPGAAKREPAPAPAKAEPSLSDQLNAIPTPGAAAAKPPASVTKNQLDAIPTPGAKPAESPAGGGSFSDQLNAIPTPGMGRTAGTSGEHGAAPPMPTPSPAAHPAQQPAGEQPEWMKKFNTYQSGITASSASGFPVQDPNAGYTPQTRDTPASAGGGYTMIAVLVVVIVLAFFGFQMMNKTPPADFNASTNTNTSTPSSSLPGTPVQPTEQPYTPPVYNPPGSMQSPPPATENSVTVQ